MTRITGLVAAAALGMLLAACGGGGTEGIASLQDAAATGDDSSTIAPAAATDPEQAMLDFAQCMRDHGIDMPDPQMGAGGGAFGIAIQGEIGSGPAAGEMQKMQEADEACRHFLEGIVQEFQQPDMAEMQDEMLAFSQCMRDHGIDYPDPIFDDNGGVTLMAPPGGGMDPGDPAFQAAQEACGAVFGGAGGPITITGSSGGIAVDPGGAGGEVIPVPSSEDGGASDG